MRRVLLVLRIGSLMVFSKFPLTWRSKWGAVHTLAMLHKAARLILYPA